MRVALVLAVGLLLYGCKTGSSPAGGPSPLVDTWVTEACAPLAGVGGATPAWSKGEYELTSDGLITWRTAAYDDGECTTGVTLMDTSADADTTLRFRDLGLTPLQEGMIGHRLQLQWREGTTIVLDRQDIHAVRPTGNRLCTSGNLRLRGGAPDYSAARGTQIDFDECLVRGVLPGMPACDDPAPLHGEPHDQAPGFIVMFRDGVPAVAEVNRLSGLYDMEVLAIYALLGGFAALMSDAVMEAVRCEASVETMHYNGFGTTQGQ